MKDKPRIGIMLLKSLKVQKLSNLSKLFSRFALGVGCKDILLTLANINLPVYLAWTDIRQRYRRSTLGPFWITISTAVMVACLGFIFGNLFKSSIQVFLPFLASGMLIWGFINSALHEACNSFVSYQAIITQLPIPLFTHVIRMIARNLYIFLHNIIILPVVLIIVNAKIGWIFLLFFPGLTLLIINLLWMSLILAIICTRFRDMTQIVNSILQVFFYATPIIWMPQLMPERAALFVLDFNPFFHLIQLVRAPLLDEYPTFSNWFISCIMAILGCRIAVAMFNKYRTRISYWL